MHNFEALNLKYNFETLLIIVYFQKAVVQGNHSHCH